MAQRYKQYAFRTRHSMDLGLLACCLALIGIGCFFIYDFTVVGDTVPEQWYYLIRQISYGLCGICVMYVISHIDYHYLKQLWPWALVLFLAGWLALLAAGPGGPIVRVGDIPIHVGQLMQLAALLVVAGLFSAGGEESGAGLWGSARALLRLLLPLGLLCAGMTSAWNLTHSIILLLVWFTLLCSYRLSWFIGMAACCGVAGTLLAAVMDEVPLDIQIWMDPFSCPEGWDYGICQSIYAVADGGLMGVGIGRGTLRYTVDACGSAILPAMAQEVGLVGVAVVVLLFLIFLFRAFRIVLLAPDRWGFYLTGAIVARFSVVFVLYLAACVNLIPPVEDLGLPFMSYGGTSLLIDCLLVGILLSVGRFQAECDRRWPQ